MFKKAIEGLRTRFFVQFFLAVIVLTVPLAIFVEHPMIQSWQQDNTRVQKAEINPELVELMNDPRTSHVDNMNFIVREDHWELTVTDGSLPSIPYERFTSAEWCITEGLKLKLKIYLEGESKPYVIDFYDTTFAPGLPLAYIGNLGRYYVDHSYIVRAAPPAPLKGWIVAMTVNLVLAGVIFGVVLVANIWVFPKLNRRHS